MEGANTEVWGQGLCTNTWKVNSSWWTQKKPTHKSHKIVPNTLCSFQCVCPSNPTPVCGEGTGLGKDTAHVKTCELCLQSIYIHPSSSVLVYTVSTTRQWQTGWATGNLSGGHSRRETHIQDQGATHYLVSIPSADSKGPRDSLTPDVKHRISKTSHRATWS